MNRLLGFILILVLAAGLVGCSDDDEDLIIVTSKPITPQGVTSVTGNAAVHVFWYGPYQADIASFRVWRSLEPVDNYIMIGTIQAESNPNLDLIQYEFIDASAPNGQTFFYAVTSVDRGGRESELSAENVFDTPRPEGDVSLWASLSEFPGFSGYVLSEDLRVDWNSAAADVYVDSVDGVFFLNARDVDTDLQDVGFTSSFDDIGWAPTEGWSVNGWTELILGHTYIIRTRDLNYAKMRVESINTGSVTFQWAYQTVADLPELAPGHVGAEKPQHGPEYLRKINSGADQSADR